jgi:hypothetical protein
MEMQLTCLGDDQWKQLLTAKFPKQTTIIPWPEVLWSLLSI